MNDEVKESIEWTCQITDSVTGFTYDASLVRWGDDFFISIPWIPNNLKEIMENL